jgi:hypothetical protein
MAIRRAATASRYIGTSHTRQTTGTRLVPREIAVRVDVHRHIYAIRAILNWPSAQGVVVGGVWFIPLPPVFPGDAYSHRHDM